MFSFKATERKETCHVRMHTEENKVLSLITLFRERSWWHNKEEKEIQTRKRRQGITKHDKNENGREGNWNKEENEMRYRETKR